MLSYLQEKLPAIMKQHTQLERNEEAGSSFPSYYQEEAKRLKKS